MSGLSLWSILIRLKVTPVDRVLGVDWVLVGVGVLS